MALDLAAAVQRIKRVGQTNVRAVPMSGQNVQGGDYQIEICEGGSWSAIVTGIKQPMAEDIISQASNRVILG
jgi:hypothetical protein